MCGFQCFHFSNEVVAHPGSPGELVLTPLPQGLLKDALHFINNFSLHVSNFVIAYYYDMQQHSHAVFRQRRHSVRHHEAAEKKGNHVKLLPQLVPHTLSAISDSTHHGICALKELAF